MKAHWLGHHISCPVSKAALLCMLLKSSIRVVLLLRLTQGQGACDWLQGLVSCFPNPTKGPAGGVGYARNRLTHGLTETPDQPCDRLQ
jgi:hypothetical protein